MAPLSGETHYHALCKLIKIGVELNTSMLFKNYIKTFKYKSNVLLLLDHAMLHV